MLSAGEPTNAGPIPKFAKVLFQMPECQDLGELTVLHTCVDHVLLDMLGVLICFECFDCFWDHSTSVIFGVEDCRAWTAQIGSVPDCFPDTMSVLAASVDPIVPSAQTTSLIVSCEALRGHEF